MSETLAQTRDYSQTLFLPQTDFPMRAGLPQREPEILARWNRLGLYRRLREAAKGRARFILHDGPPYANGHIHLGHALNKILKDLVTRSQQMLGHDSNYVPGWDCHGLPIEWKIEEEYRAKGQDKDAVPVVEFRRQCRAFAEKWIGVQREEFKRLGVEGDWAHPYTTMAFAAEAQIARELMKFAMTDQLYRGSKPVMWSVVERTALAEAEVEYHEHVSTTVFVKFPVVQAPFGPLVDFPNHKKVLDALQTASVLIWTTTPWTIPANRAIAFSRSIAYGLYDVTAAAADNWAKVGDRFLLADNLADGIFKAARVGSWERIGGLSGDVIDAIVCAHPLRGHGYNFWVPLIAADYVTEEAGTGFVHTAPGHGADDYDTFQRHRAAFEAAGTPEVPHTVGPDGAYYADVPLFSGARVLDDHGKEGEANARVIAALAEAGMLVARGTLRHQYPHSWRSKAPLIFRNTPQWFIAMDKPIADADLTGRPAARPGLSRLIDKLPGVHADHGHAKEGASPAPQGKDHARTLRERALEAIRHTTWVPAQGENRITGMIESRPDWVISRQRAWGVPITVFVDKATGEVLKDEAVNARIAAAFEAEGADAWFADADGSRFLRPERDPADYEKVTDILDVWFDSGATHAFTLETRDDLKVKHRPIEAALAPKRPHDHVMYLEGSDQHRGWFHSSLLESCGTRGRAPFDIVLTHGFILDERGVEKMSKSKGNTISPQQVMKDQGADILRLWVAASDYADDVRFGLEVLKTFVDTYRKLRNTLRWLLGSLHHFAGHDIVPFDRMPELERLMLHRLVELDGQLREAYAGFDYKRVVAVLSAFMTGDLSAFYVDVRKDALYCDPWSSLKRHSALTVIDQLFRCLVTWLAPILVFTTEEAWLTRFPSEAGSVHLEPFPIVPATWRNDRLAAKWTVVRRIRRVVTGALEIERAGKRIGSSLEAAPLLFLEDPALAAALKGVDFAEVCLTSGIRIEAGKGPPEAFRLDEVPGVAVLPELAAGRRCARSWKVSPDVGADPAFPDLTPRDAAAMREWEARRKGT